MRVQCWLDGVYACRRFIAGPIRCVAVTHLSGPSLAPMMESIEHVKLSVNSAVTHRLNQAATQTPLTTRWRNTDLSVGRTEARVGRGLGVVRYEYHTHHCVYMQVYEK